MNILLMSMPDIIAIYPTQVMATPNLGLASLVGNLDPRHRVKIADLVLKRKNIKKALIFALEKTQPELVGLSAMTFQYHNALKIAKFIKANFPHIKVALGGYHASIMYEEISESKDGEFFDFIFRGEAELSFNETVNRLEGGESFDGIGGLSYKQEGRFIHNKKGELVELAQLKLPDRKARLWNTANVVGIPYDLIESSRGCLMSCNFCNIRTMYGNSFRTYDIERVIQDMQNAKDAGTRIMLFSDDNITLDQERFIALCDAIIARGLNDLILGVQVSSAGIASSEKMVKKMAQAGFDCVFLGIENASKKNLESLQKGNIIEKTRQAVKYLHQNGIFIAGGIIIGNPNDDMDSIEESFQFVDQLNVEFPGAQFLVPYPKVEIREQLLKDQLIRHPRDFKHYNGDFPMAETHYLNEDQLKLAAYTFNGKYFKTMGFKMMKSLAKPRKKFLGAFKGLLRLVPHILNLLVIGNLMKLFVPIKTRSRRYYKKLAGLNEFDI